jgi:hypothetical protein
MKKTIPGFNRYHRHTITREHMNDPRIRPLKAAEDIPMASTAANLCAEDSYG